MTWDLYSFCSARLCRSRSRLKVADAASGHLEPSDKICEIAEAPAKFESAMLKHFAFTCVKRWEKGDRQAENNMQTLSD